MIKVKIISAPTVGQLEERAAQYLRDFTTPKGNPICVAGTTVVKGTASPCITITYDDLSVPEDPESIKARTDLLNTMPPKEVEQGPDITEQPKEPPPPPKGPPNILRKESESVGRPETEEESTPPTPAPETEQPSGEDKTIGPKQDI